MLQLLSFSDWRLANTFELESICNEDLNDTTLNYAPFSSGKLAQGAFAYTSTTNVGDSTQAYILYSKFSATRSRILSQTAKTVSTKRYLLLRKSLYIKIMKAKEEIIIDEVINAKELEITNNIFIECIFTDEKGNKHSRLIKEGDELFNKFE